VSEVSPDGEVWANLTSLVRSTNFTETGFPEAKHELLGFAVQLHFCDSKNITNRKREDISATDRFVLSFCLLYGFGLSPFAFDRSNAMLAFLSKREFSAKDITPLRFFFY
jgi:hypothetical protein